MCSLQEHIEREIRERQQQQDVQAAHQIDHQYDTVLHEQCLCGRRWMMGKGKLEAHHAEVLASSNAAGGL